MSASTARRVSARRSGSTCLTPSRPQRLARCKGEAPSEPRANGETILVVEDQAEVRRIVVRQLTSLGYRVLEAENAQTAFQTLRTDTPIDLLFTDIVMPGVSGIEVAAAARKARPDLRVLLTSGFADGFAGGAPSRRRGCGAHQSRTVAGTWRAGSAASWMTSKALSPPTLRVVTDKR